MELALNTGAFEALDYSELLAVDGGVDWNNVGITVSGVAGGYIGAKAGAAIGVKIGTACAPGVGTVVGGIVGAALGVIIYSLWD